MKLVSLKNKSISSKSHVMLQSVLATSQTKLVLMDTTWMLSLTFSLNHQRLQLQYMLTRMRLTLVLAIRALCLVMRLMNGILNHFTPTLTGSQTSFARSSQHKDTQVKFHGYVLTLNPKLSLSIRRRTMVNWLQFVFTTFWFLHNTTLTFLKRLLSQPFTRK